MQEKNSDSMNSRYDIDGDEGATTVLCAPSEDDQEGATTILRAPADDSEGETTVLKNPVFHQPTFGQSGYGSPNLFGQTGPMYGQASPGYEQCFSGQTETLQGKKPIQKAGHTKKAGNKLALVLGLCALVLLALGISTYFLFLTPQKCLERNLRVGAEALDADNYEEALLRYERALEIEEENVEAMLGVLDAKRQSQDLDGAQESYEQFYALLSNEKSESKTDSKDIVDFYLYAGHLWTQPEQLIPYFEHGYESTKADTIKTALVQAYVKSADAIADTEYEKKIAQYQKAKSLDENNAQANSGMSNCAIATLDAMLAQKNFDEAELFITKYQNEIHNVDFEAYAQTITQTRALIEASVYVCEQVMAYADAKNYDAIKALYGTEQAKLLFANLENDCYIYASEGYTDTYSGQATGVYKVGEAYCFYSGDYADGVRSGHGIWFVYAESNGDTYSYYDGMWKEDAPNGAGTIYYMNRKSAGTTINQAIQGDFLSGMLNGVAQVTIADTNGEFCGTVVANQGKVEDVRDQYPDYDFMDAPEDAIVYVVLEQEGSDFFWWLSMKADERLGVYGY